GDSEGEADLLRVQGLDGRGVVVGVISDGIDHVADAQRTADLPNVTVPSGGCRRGSGDEGTALLEIVHDIAPGAQLLFAGPADNTNTVVVPPGGTLTCILQWNDPFGASANDYDLFLLDQNLNVVAVSNDPQVGAQDPIEAISVSNLSNANALANLVIDRFGQS